MEEREPIAWRVHVETLPGFNISGDQLDVMLSALEADERVGAGGISFDPERGIVGATVSVESPRHGFATETAIAAFYDALRAAGYRVDMPGWQLNVEREALFTADD